MKIIPLFMVLFGGVVGTTEAAFPLPGIERWGIAGVCGLAAWLLWRKLDHSDMEKLKLHREAVEIQRASGDQIIEIVREQQDVSRRLSEAMTSLRSELARRPCLRGLEGDD